MIGFGALCLLGGSFPAGSAAEVAAGPARRVVSLDLLLTELLLTLEIVPAAIGNVPLYSRLVAQPAVPDGVPDLGPLQTPNLELLQYLAPDLILAPEWLRLGRTPFARIAPVAWLPTFSKTTDALNHAEELLRQVASFTGREAAAERAIGEGARACAAARHRLAGVRARPVLVVRFMEDGRHAAVFGGKGMVGGVLQRLGLNNAWTGHTNVWGVTSIGIERLADFPEAQLVHFDRGAETARALKTLDASPLWRALPMVKAGRVTGMPVVYPNGGPLSAQRFAEQLAAAFLAAGSGDD